MATPKSQKQGSNRKVALITGSSRGIGKATALLLAKEGYAIVINYHRSKQSALLVAKELVALGVEHLVIQADIANEREVKSMFATIRKKFGALDVLVNNAGILSSQPFSALTLQNFDHILGVNLRGSILVTKHALPLLTKVGHAKIVFVLSSSVFVGTDSLFAYAVSKAGLLGAVRSLALELAPRGIMVNGVVPGYVNTTMAGAIKSQMKKGLRKIPLQRVAEPEEVAKLVGFLVSPHNTYMTGQCVHINGGRFLS